MTFDAQKAFDLLSAVPGLTVTENAPLAKYNTYRTGGPARILVRPRTKEELMGVVKLIHDHSWPYYLLGKGSNVLISDEGLDGIVICLKLFKGIEIKKMQSTLYAYAGENMATVIKAAREVPLAGLEKLGGIPGSIGGSMIMNAGAYGAEIGDCVVYVDCLNPDGSEVRIMKEDCGFVYRDAPGLRGKLVVGALFLMDPSSYEAFLEGQADAVANLRARKQPLHYPSCGSVFKNPEGMYAGEIIDKCGLKGTTIGNAQISEMHANFFVNLYKCKSQDIYELMLYTQKFVRENRGIELEPEVKLLGSFQTPEGYTALKSA